MLFKIAAVLIHVYLKFVFFTSRWHVKGYNAILENAKARKPQIYAFWHGRTTIMPSRRPKMQDTYLISSRHRDGQLSSQILQTFGLKIIHGSSRRAGSTKDRGGRGALMESLRKLRAGNAVAITPDGPRGPHMRVGGHIVTIAKMTGAEIIPMSFSSSRAHFFKSWDRLLLPLPFANTYYFIGKPIAVPRDADDETIEKIRKQLEVTLIELTLSADTAAKRKEIAEPAPIV